MTTHNAAESPEALLQAFAKTDYLVCLGQGDAVVHVGYRHPRLDQWLDGRGWTIITAYNPGGRRTEDASNVAGHRQLLEHPALKGRTTVPTLNRDPNGRWPDEPGCLVVDLPASERARLAETFGQAALVQGERDGIAGLELFGPGWPGQLPEWARHGV